jgi:hypothetical protein
MNCQRHNVHNAVKQSGLDKCDWLPENMHFHTVEVQELVNINSQTGAFEVRGASCLILTGDDTSEGRKVTVKIHYDTTTGVYTVISHETEEL